VSNYLNLGRKAAFVAFLILMLYQDSVYSMNEETDSAPPSMGVTKLMSTDNREEKKLLQRPGSLARYTEAELELLGAWTHENFFDKTLNPYTTGFDAGL